MKIYDNFLDKQFLDYINQSLQRLEWTIHRSEDDQKTPFFFNSITINHNIQKNEYCFLFDIISNVIIKDFGIEERNIFLERGYVNLYPFGIGGDWHKDSVSKDGKTILFYPCDWKEEYGGATEFQYSGEKVEYKKNRLLIFDGILSHRSMTHRNIKNRYTIAYKIQINYN
jgi:hypothetical protein